MAYRASFGILRTLVEISSVGKICVDESRQIVYANEAAEKLFGYIRDELADVLIDQLVPVDINEKHIQYMQQYFDNPETKIMGKGRAIEGRKRNGDKIKVKVTLEKPFAEDGKRYFTISILPDE